jgi:hypothetical protein
LWIEVFCAESEYKKLRRGANHNFSACFDKRKKRKNKKRGKEKHIQDFEHVGQSDFG